MPMKTEALPFIAVLRHWQPGHVFPLQYTNENDMMCHRMPFSDRSDYPHGHETGTQKRQLNIRGGAETNCKLLIRWRHKRSTAR